MPPTNSHRPFDGFKTAITDPDFFFGRADVIRRIIDSPSMVHVLIGGRRIGKTSALRAIEWSLLTPASPAGNVFPVYISLDVEQPSGLDNFRYVLIRRLRDAIERWSKSPGAAWRERYRAFLRQIAGGEVGVGSLVKLKLENPEQTRRLAHQDFREAFIATLRDLRKLSFDGILFVLDEAEYVVRRDWANDAWSYFRGLKDTDTAIKPFLGIVLAGYRDIKEYAQRVGSPLLNIAEVAWMSPLKADECGALMAQRGRLEGCPLGYSELEMVGHLSGGHPFLVQQILNVVLDDLAAGATSTKEALVRRLLASDLIDRTFTMWWNEGDRTDGFRLPEREMYRALASEGDASVDKISELSGRSWPVVTGALEVLVGTGIATFTGELRCSIGSELFSRWVSAQSTSDRT